MKKNILILILFVIFILVITFLIKKINYINSNQQKNKLKNNFNQNVTQITPILESKNLISYMFFSYKLESINQNKKILTIYLNGSEDSLADAADLTLTFDKNIIIEKIIEGDSFVFYPRKLIKDNSLIITGVSLSEENKLKFAKPNTKFITIILDHKINKDKPLFMILNNSESKIFFNGKDITNLDKQFKKITIN